MATIIPFGKYINRTVDEVVGLNPGYFDWLAAQSWGFKFQYLIDEAKGLTGPTASHDDDSPEHNLIQARFLKDVFCVALLNAAGMLTVEGVQRRYAQSMQETLVLLCSDHIEGFRKAMTGDHYGYYGSRQFGTPDHIDVYRDWMVNPQQIVNRMMSIETAFEGFSDVSIRLWAGDKRGHNRLFEAQVWVEIKPSVGDNFPAYIRQIKAQRLRGHRQLGGGDMPVIIMLYDKYAATLPENDVCEMFRRSGIPTLTINEVENRLVEAQNIIDVIHGRR